MAILVDTSIKSTDMQDLLERLAAQRLSRGERD